MNKRGYVAQGCRRRDRVRVNIAFDEDTFAEIQRRAVKAGTSFNEIAVLLIEWGLEAVEPAHD